MEQLYSTIGDIQDVLQSRHDQYGVRTSFVRALEYLLGCGRLQKNRPTVPLYGDPLEDDAFDGFLRQLPVDATQIMEDAHGKQLIAENKTIPADKDVFILKHVPYVDDSLHSHDYFEINYIYAGSCTQIFENERRTLNAGEMCIISPYAPHNILVEAPSLALGILMRKSTFDKMFWRLLTQKDLLSSFFRHSLYENNEANYLFLQTDNRTEIRHLVQSLVVEVHTEDSYANSIAASLVSVLFAKILRRYSDTFQLYNIKPQLYRELDFSLLLQYIQQNYQTVTLQSLAEMFHFSEGYLSRHIKKNLGKGFSATIQDLRLNHAAASLRNTSMKIHEIAEMVGYDSVDHFSRSFKKAYGTTPRAYRSTIEQQ